MDCNTTLRTKRFHQRAFTLVEILIVVVILGILAAIVLPQFSDASQQSREVSLRNDLRIIRTQIDLYKVQHQDILPGFPNCDVNETPTGELFAQQLIKHTSLKGVVGDQLDQAHPLGPYLLQSFPRNPITGKSAVMVVFEDQALPTANASIDAGWIFNALTGQFVANVPGVDTNGVPFSEY